MGHFDQTSADVDLAALAASIAPPRLGRTGVIRIDNVEGPWTIRARIFYPSKPAGAPGPLITTQIPKCWLEIAEGRERSKSTVITRPRFARDITYVSHASSIDVSLVTEGFVGAQVPVRVEIWATKDRAAAGWLPAEQIWVVDVTSFQTLVQTDPQLFEIPPDVDAVMVGLPLAGFDPFTNARVALTYPAQLRFFTPWGVIMDDYTLAASSPLAPVIPVPPLARYMALFDAALLLNPFTAVSWRRAT